MLRGRCLAGRSLLPSAILHNMSVANAPLGGFAPLAIHRCAPVHASRQQQLSRLSASAVHFSHPNTQQHSVLHVPSCREQCIPKTPFLGSRSRGSIQHRPYAAQNSSTSSTDAGDEAISSSSGNSALQSIGLTAAVMGLGVLNRVLYKMALVPLGDYVFFLAQFQTFGYVVVYFSALAIRYRAGIVTKDMLAAPNKKLFLWIGALEALSQLLGFIGASKLPGVVLPLLQQSMLLWQVALAYLVLNKRLAPVQIGGALLVIAGVLTAAWPADGGSNIFTEMSPLYASVFVASMLFPALATIFKEKIFTDAKQKLGGKQLDIFVVNSFGSGAQAVVVFLLLPGLAALRGISPGQLPQYLSEGASCLRGITPACAGDCSLAPVLAASYVACNLGLNISALALLRSAGNVVQSLTFQSIVPLTIWAFTLPVWPLLDPAPPLGPQFIAGTAILLGGLLTYNSPQWRPALQRWLKQRS